jgi:hypothetical protein
MYSRTSAPATSHERQRTSTSTSHQQGPPTGHESHRAKDRRHTRHTHPLLPRSHPKHPKAAPQPIPTARLNSLTTSTITTTSSPRWCWRPTRAPRVRHSLRGSLRRCCGKKPLERVGLHNDAQLL